MVYLGPLEYGGFKRSPIYLMPSYPLEKNSKLAAFVNDLDCSVGVAIIQNGWSKHPKNGPKFV